MPASESRTYEVIVGPIAQDDVERAFRWYVRRNPLHAIQWYDDLARAILSLECNPLRCSVAPEGRHCSAPPNNTIALHSATNGTTNRCRTRVTPTPSPSPILVSPNLFPVFTVVPMRYPTRRRVTGLETRNPLEPLRPKGFREAGEGSRTPDLLITNQLLYRLSYASVTS